MTNKRIFIELIEKRNANGSLKKKKHFIKPLLTMHDTLQAMRIGSNFQKINEEEDYIPMAEVDELFNFVVELFDGQFTQMELEKGLPFGDEGFSAVMDVVMKVANANQESDTKSFLEEKKN